jgi:hypothetical protein
LSVFGALRKRSSFPHELTALERARARLEQKLGEARLGHFDPDSM